MIPILASIIGGEKEMTGKEARHSQVLVLGMATSYAMTGILVTTLAKGINLQAAMQQPWLFSSFAAVFVLLALTCSDSAEPAHRNRQKTQQWFRQTWRRQDRQWRRCYGRNLSLGGVTLCQRSSELVRCCTFQLPAQDWMFGGATLFCYGAWYGCTAYRDQDKWRASIAKKWRVDGIRQARSVWRTAIGCCYRAIKPLCRSIDHYDLMGAIPSVSGIFGALEAALPGWARTRKFSALLPLVTV